VSDFGLAAVWNIQASGKTRKLTDVCGSLPYIAPEVVPATWVVELQLIVVYQLGLGRPYDAPPIDIWGMGVILFTLLVGSKSVLVWELTRHDKSRRYTVG
jgi:serine/threonine-protein kinase Chk1